MVLQVLLVKMGLLAQTGSQVPMVCLALLEIQVRMEILGFLVLQAPKDP